MNSSSPMSTPATQFSPSPMGDACRPNPTPTVELTPAACVRLSDALKRWTGVTIEPDKTYLFRGRLRDFMLRRQLITLDKLLDRCDLDREVRERVVDLLTTHETLFFRDGHPFETVADRLIPERLAADSSVIRIHCLACSTGQEPYSLAMRLKEKLTDVMLRRIDIQASDISHGTIAQARQGEFLEHELRRGLSPMQRKRFFESVAAEPTSGRARLIGEVRGMVKFGVMNLIGLANSPPPAPLDICFCRNVLIYFDGETRQQVLRGLSKWLRPGGVLILGSSEMLRDQEGLFRTETIGMTAIHRRI